MKTFQLTIGEEKVRILLENYPRLEFADPKELKNYKVSAESVRWPDLGVDISIYNLELAIPSQETAVSFLKWLKQRL